MRRSAIWSAFSVMVVAAVYVGCTQDFGQFEGTGGGTASSTGSGGTTTNGGGGTTTTTTTTNGGGGTGGCKDVSTCPMPVGDCTLASCEGGDCGFTNVGMGKGCKTDGGTKCDGNGNCVVCLIDADCGGTLHCDLGKNQCVGCDDNNPCMASGTDCVTVTCSSQGTCDSTINSPHSCTDNGGKVCTAAGACVDCIGNGDCTLPETCSGGGIANKCGCTKTTCVAAGKTCGMVSDACGGMLNCSGAKDGSETDTDCGGDASACSARCPNQDGCMIDGDCANGHCAAHPNQVCGKDNAAGCASDGECASNECAPIAGNKCGKDNGEGCTAGSDCASTKCATHPAQKCGVDNGGACATDAVCANQHCSTNPASKCGQDNAGACAADTDCASGHCSAMPAMLCGLDKGTACVNNNQCASGSCDTGGTMKCL